MPPHRLILAAGFVLAMGWLHLTPCQTPRPAGDEKGQSAEPPPASSGVIKSEANLVLVDAVVTDKKKRYLKDLAQKEFHLFEDGVQQNIVTFSREADIKPDTPGYERYFVLFFDNTAVESEYQAEEREAARTFVEKSAGPNRMMAVVGFRGALHVAQNFTANSDQLNNAIKGVKFSADPADATGSQDLGASIGIPQRDSAAGKQENNFDAHGLFRAIRGIASLLSTVPGRKAMIFLSAGFELNGEREADLRTTLDLLNKANIAVYPVNALGLPASAGSAPGSRGLSASGMPSTIRANDQGLYYLASRTGGFAVVGDNDLNAGIQKVAEEMQEGYMLGFVPPNPAPDGRYHRVQVKVDRSGAEVRAREGYVDLKSPDPLKGSPEAKTLEALATSYNAGVIPVTLSAPYFYVQPGVAIVNLALSIPGAAVGFEKQGGDFHSQFDILGVAYRNDGSMAARFSDAVTLHYDKQEAQQITKTPIDYQKCFKIAPGTYLLKVVLSAGEQRFGKYVLPLAVDPFSGKELTLGGPALGERIVRLTPRTADMDEALLENTKPLIANGAQVVPSTSNRFAKGARAVAYVEIYGPSLKTADVQVGILFKIIDRSTNRPVYSSYTIPASHDPQAGKPLVPLIFNLPMDQLHAGNYRLEVWGRDSEGNISTVRSSDFSIE